MNMHKRDKAQYLFERMDLIDSKFIEEAENYVPKKSVIRRKFAVVMALAACLSVLIVFGIGSMLIDTVRSSLNSPFEKMTLSSVLKQNSTSDNVIDISDLNLLDGKTRIIWQNTESGTYYEAEIPQNKYNLASSNTYAQKATDPDAPEYRIWFVSSSGEVTSPHLVASSGNVYYGALFDYNPELEITDTFIQKLDAVLN